MSRWPDWISSSVSWSGCLPSGTSATRTQSLRDSRRRQSSVHARPASSPSNINSTFRKFRQSISLLVFGQRGSHQGRAKGGQPAEPSCSQRIPQPRPQRRQSSPSRPDQGYTAPGSCESRPEIYTSALTRRSPGRRTPPALPSAVNGDDHPPGHRTLAGKESGAEQIECFAADSAKAAKYGCTGSIPEARMPAACWSARRVVLTLSPFGGLAFGPAPAT